MRTLKQIASVLIVVATISGSPNRGVAIAAQPTEKGTVHTVEAGVGYASKGGVGIQVERQPGEFTIPKGSLGASLQYRFTDPTTDYTSTKLRGSNIYSVTEKRYLRELDTDPSFKLPPGDYRFVVGGTVGARGVLTYSIVVGVQENPPPGTIGGTSLPPPSPPIEPTSNPPRNDDEATTAAMKALVGGWGGTYTVERVTGDATGLGTVQGKRAIGIAVQRDAAGLQATGSVWVPPGWFGRPGRVNVDGSTVWFNVNGRPMGGKTLVLSFSGTLNAATGTISGELIGFVTKTDVSEEVFRGTWHMTRK